ncbi:Kazal-type serine protease inhibitor family protein [Candidatus Woesearchaeota archaeon]|nr:Kazal-type serine protease inhibitor family protein [Candidatus Woesearchaeota archaeon]
MGKQHKPKYGIIMLAVIIVLIATAVIIANYRQMNYKNSVGDAKRAGSESLSRKTGSCSSNNDCPGNQFCEFMDCLATKGRCIYIPQNCFDLWNPVCGCNGKTYSNDCYRRMAQVSRDYFGECKKIEEAYFEVIDAWEDTLIIKLIDPIRIQEARDILAGRETEKTHVMGTVVKQPADYNPGWSYHLSPFSIQFFATAIEVCDGAFRDVEKYLEEVCGAFLPNCVFCPWASRLTKEVYIGDVPSDRII